MNIVSLAPILFAYFHEIEALHSYEDLTIPEELMLAQTKGKKYTLSLDQVFTALLGEEKYSRLIDKASKSEITKGVQNQKANIHNNLGSCFENAKTQWMTRNEACYSNLDPKSCR